MRPVIAVVLGAAVWAALQVYYHNRTPGISLWKKGVLCVIGIVFMVVCFLWGDKYQIPYINCLRNEVVAIWLLIIGLIDWKEEVIPKVLTHAGLCAWILLVCAALITGSTIRSVLLFSFGGFLMGGGLFFLCKLLSKGGIGMGDVRAFSVIGLLYGMNYTFSIVFFTILFMAVFGLAAIVLKKKDMKSQVPMGPFICMAYLVSCVLGV